MKPLHKDFVKLVVDALPPSVRTLLVETGPKIMVAGGFVRDTITGATPKDVDLFGLERSMVYEAAGSFEENDEKGEYGRSETENAITFLPLSGPLVQFIIRDIRNTHEQTLKAFDFSICQAGVYFDADNGWVGIASDAFFTDLVDKRLTYTDPPHNNALGSLLRLVRFTERGWSSNDPTVAAILGRVTKELESFNPLLTTASVADHVTRAQNAIAVARRYPDWAPVTNPPVEETDEVPF